MRAALIGILFLCLAAVGGVAWVSLQPPPQEAVAPVVVPRITVLSAVRPLRAGTLLKPDDIATIEIDAATAPEGTRPDNPQARAELFGAMLRRSMLPGEPMLREDVLRPGDHGFLAAVLAPGTRAVSVGVDAVSGTAGLIWPGDRVDLLLTQTMDDHSLPLARRVSGETVLSDVRVIAIDQRLAQGAAAENENATAARTVTLEVNSRQAERVAVASRLGRLSLVVRAIPRQSDDVVATTEDPPITWGGDVSPALRQGGSRAPSNNVRVYQGATRSEEFRF